MCTTQSPRLHDPWGLATFLNKGVQRTHNSLAQLGLALEISNHCVGSSYPSIPDDAGIKHTFSGMVVTITWAERKT